MKILLYYTPFFGYEKEMQAVLEAAGHTVEYYNPRAFRSAFGRAFYKFIPWAVTGFTNRYHKKILKNLTYDYDVMLTNDRVPQFVTQILKKRNPQIQCCLYLDDSVRNLKGIEHYLCEYDRKVTFDRTDAQKYGMEFLPLYFRKEYASENCKSAEPLCYDISFVGTCHSDRYKIIKQIKKMCDENGKTYKFYCYLQSKFVYRFYKLTKPEYRDTKITDFEFDKISAAQSSEIFRKSRCILDIQHPLQTGLTMRTMETVGAKKKLVTTNADIVNYDFYDSRNIYVADRQNPCFDISFLNGEYEETGFDTNKYSLKSWLENLLKITL